MTAATPVVTATTDQMAIYSDESVTYEAEATDTPDLLVVPHTPLAR